MKSIRNFVVVAALAAITLPAAAQRAQSPVVGTWKLVLSPKAMQGAPKGTKMPVVIMQLKNDGSMTGEASFGAKKTTMKGTWKLQGQTLTMTTTHQDGKPNTKSKPEKVTVAKDFNSFELPGAPGMGKMVKI